MNKFKVGQKAPFVENLLIIEGITRSGKFLVANIINGLEDIEPAQYSVLLEQIPFLALYDFIEKKTAQQLIRCEIDIRSYDMLIGRNLNQRLSDKSSIYNIPDYQKFLDRTKGPEGTVVLKDFQKKRIYSPFILHESMTNISIYFETFPKAKCIAIQRNPLELAYSWYKRGLTKRWGTDPILFQIPLAKHTGNKIFPWFAIGWEDIYLKSSEIDRAILSIKSLTQMAQKSYKNLPPNFKNSILIVNFESLISSPGSEIERISKFLGKKVLPQMKTILKREKLPIKKQKTKQREKLKNFKTLANKKYLKELLDLPTKLS